MKVTQVEGVDPGLVHTGLVSVVFQPQVKTITVDSTAVDGIDAPAIKLWLENHRLIGVKPSTFVEAYRPRGNLNSDVRMVEGQANIKAALPNARILNNTGVKKVIKTELMKVLGLWHFATTTHHGDIRSAARIALLGMVKNEELNLLLATVISDHLEGKSWDVITH